MRLQHKITFALLFLVLGFLLEYGLSLRGVEAPFTKLSPDEMQKRVILNRDYAIRLAKERGDYRCCMEPPCAMCYMEANPWNNFTAGTCACDDLIAQGKDPCPQCINGLCESGSRDFCIE